MYKQVLVYIVTHPGRNKPKCQFALHHYTMSTRKMLDAPSGRITPSQKVCHQNANVSHAKFQCAKQT